jgi:hypothetical protein
MPTGTFEYQTERERLAIETAIAFVSELHHLAQTAPSGNVLSLAVGLALEQGRALLRSSLAAAVQARIDSAEQKGGRTLLRVRGPAPPQAPL